MQLVCTLFDHHRDGRPVMSGVWSPEGAWFNEFYNKGSTKSIYEIEQGLAGFSSRLTGDVLLNDYKQHLMGFKLRAPGTIYDCPLVVEGPRPMMAVALGLKAMRQIKPAIWHKIRADASPAYKDMQERGIVYNYTKMHPVWHLDVFSGRSRAVGFAAQGLTDGDVVENVNGDTLLLHFDWAAADLRAAAVMSGDKDLNQAFIKSDPYQVLVDKINADGVGTPLTRDEGKICLLAALNSFDVDSEVLGAYPQLREWMMACQAKIQRDGYLTSILGRVFRVNPEEDRSEKSVFNATVQGTVAHAMQVSIRRIWDRYPDKILLEHHDSIILTARDGREAGEIIKFATGVMVQPFAGILTDNPTFPVVVSVGRQFRKWQKLKRFNGPMA